MALAQELDCEFNFDPTVAPRADGKPRCPRLSRLGHEPSGAASQTTPCAGELRVASQRHPSAPAGDTSPGMSNCGAGSSSAFIDARGDVYACMGFPAPFGDVAATGFAGVWRA